MKSIIVGGGKIGYNLLKTLKNKDYDVTLIERNIDTCNEIADDINANIVLGDGTDLEVLKDADIENADVVAAVTGADEGNLVICQIAKDIFHVNKTIARINNPKNIQMFKALGVDKAVCSTEVIANLIEWEVEKDQLKIVQTFERGAMVLIEISIDEKSIWCDRKVKSLDLPEDCVIVSIIRKNGIVYPRGSTGINKGDRVLAVISFKIINELKRTLRGKRK